MIVKFNNFYLEDLYKKNSIGGKPKFNNIIIKKFKKVVQIIKFVEGTQQLYDLKSLHFEKLSGDLTGYYSCRVNLKYRLILSIEVDAVSVKEMMVVEDLNNHYG